MWWFDGWCRRALRRHFYRLHLYLESTDEWHHFDPRRPRIYVVNHSSFWDGIVLYYLMRTTRAAQPLYCMIDERQVLEHPFFTRVGGFSICRDDPRDAVRSIRYAVDLLLHPDRPGAVVVFPQGRIEPNDIRPIRIEAAIPRLIAACPEAAVVPIALRYEFWTEQRAESLIHIGSELHFHGATRPQIVQRLQTALANSIDHLRQAGLDHRPAERIILRGRESISRWKQLIPGRASAE